MARQRTGDELPQINVRVLQEVIDEMDRLARMWDLKRSDIHRRALTLGLRHLREEGFPSTSAEPIPAAKRAKRAKR